MFFLKLSFLIVINYFKYSFLLLFFFKLSCEAKNKLTSVMCWFDHFKKTSRGFVLRNFFCASLKNKRCVDMIVYKNLALNPLKGGLSSKKIKKGNSLMKVWTLDIFSFCAITKSNKMQIFYSFLLCPFFTTWFKL